MTDQQLAAWLQLNGAALSARADSIDRTIAAVKAWRGRHPTDEDRAIFRALPISVQAGYMLADQQDGAMATQRLRCMRSIARSVQIEILTDLMCEAREARVRRTAQ